MSQTDPHAGAPGPPYESELTPVAGATEHLSVTDLRHVRLNVTANLGNCSLLVRDVLELRRGSVLAMDKIAGEMIDLYVNGIPFAKGEVVVFGDSLHVRIAEIINPRGNYEL